MVRYLNFLFFFFLFCNLKSQDLNLYEEKIYIFENDTLNYRLLKPLDYDSEKKYPVHLFLHGSGERGNNNFSQLTQRESTVSGSECCIDSSGRRAT